MRAEMKKLYIVGGTMGAGKTTVCQIMKEKLDNAVFLDGDWLWDSHPFTVTEETKSMVMNNIKYMLNRFINCTAYENIIFCWVMHEQKIIDDIIGGIAAEKCEIKAISLICGEKTLKEHLEKDIADGTRSPDIIERSIGRIPLYEKLDTVKISVDGKSAQQTANEIIALA